MDVERPFSVHLAEAYTATRWIEPPWKLILSSKGILALLWELFPHHPNLLEAYLSRPGSLRDYVRKPFFSREGANITIVQGGQRPSRIARNLCRRSMGLPGVLPAP